MHDLPAQESWRTARKRHYCSECGEEIRPGHRYRAMCGKQDGDFWSGSQCGFCAWIFGLAVEYARAQQMEYDDYPCYGGLWEWLEEDWLNQAPQDERDAYYAKLEEVRSPLHVYL